MHPGKIHDQEENRHLGNEHLQEGRFEQRIPEPVCELLCRDTEPLRKAAQIGQHLPHPLQAFEKTHDFSGFVHGGFKMCELSYGFGKPANVFAILR